MISPYQMAELAVRACACGCVRECPLCDDSASLPTDSQLRRIAVAMLGLVDDGGFMSDDSKELERLYRANAARETAILARIAFMRQVLAEES